MAARPTAAQLNNPAALTFDTAGNLYIADAANHRVRKITPAGVISTAAGTGEAGFSGDGGAAASAQLNSPQGLTADADGNVYIADSGNNRIRKLLPDGTLHQYRGQRQCELLRRWRAGGRGVAARSARHLFAGGGHIYIADTGNQRIRELLPDGTITTVAGNGGQGPGGDGGLATSAQLNLPTGVTLDAAGNIYIADQGNNRVREVMPNGTISTLAGSAAYGLGDGGPATAALLDAPDVGGGGCGGQRLLERYGPQPRARSFGRNDYDARWDGQLLLCGRWRPGGFGAIECARRPAGGFVGTRVTWRIRVTMRCG